MIKQAKNFGGIDFRCGNYLDMEIPKNSLLYCDPPYKGTTGYKHKFDHAVFWDWCRERYHDGHIVFISEYDAPEDFICVKEVQHKTILDKNSQYKRTEKLFCFYEMGLDF